MSGRIHLDLDIAEVSRLGSDSVVKLAALAIAQFSIEALFSRSQGEFRWTPLPVILSLSRAISESLAIYIKHPLVQRHQPPDHPLTESGLSYPERRTQLRDKISRRITRLAISLFNDPGSILFESPLILFYDDAEGEAWRALAHVYKRLCLQAVAVSEIPIQTAYTLVRRNLTAAVMGKATDYGRSTRMAQLIANTLEWSKSSALPQLSGGLGRLSNGQSVRMAQCALGEALRLARLLQRVDPPLIVESHNVLNSGEWSGHQVELELPVEVAFVGTGQEWNLQFNSIEYDNWTVTRLRGRVYGLESSVGYSYLPLRSLCQGRQFLMVGCGAAAGPAVLLLGGATMCYGLDLKRDITADARMTGQYIPAHLRRLHLERNFLRIGWSHGWTGDIREPDAVKCLRVSISPNQIWVVDIPLLSIEDLTRTFWTISTVDPQAVIALRLIGRLTKVLDTCTYLSEFTEEICWHNVFSDGNFREGWVTCRVSGGISHERRRALSLPQSENLHWESIDLSVIGGGKEYLMELCTSGLSGCSQNELQVGMIQLLDMITASTGELEHRFTYNQWTDVVSALICLRVLHSEDPSQLILNILGMDRVTITLGERIISKVVDLGLRRLLSRVLSRCT